MASSPGTGWSNGPKLDPGSFNPETRDGKTAHHPPQPAPQTTGVQRAGAELCPKLLRAGPGRVRSHARTLHVGPRPRQDTPHVERAGGGGGMAVHALCFLTCRPLALFLRIRSWRLGTGCWALRGADLRSPMEPCGLSRLGFQHIHVNPHKATNTRDIHSCRVTTTSPAPGSDGRWAEEDAWSRILCPTVHRLSLTGRGGFQWAPGARWSCCGGKRGVPDTVLGHQSCLLGTSERPTALPGPARSCLDQCCLTEPSGMAEMFLHFTVSKRRSSSRA